MSSPALRPLIPIFLCSLMSIGWSVFSAEDCQGQAGGQDAEANKCLRAFCAAKNACNAAKSAAVSKASVLGFTGKADTAGKLSVKPGSGVNKSAASQAAGAYSEGKKSCASAKEDCNDQQKCQIQNIKLPAAKSLVNREKETCNTTIQSALDGLLNAENEMNRVAGGAGETGNASDGGEKNANQTPSGQPQSPAAQSPAQQASSSSPQTPQLPQMPQSQSQEEEKSKKDPQSSQASQSDPCESSNANLYAQCKAKLTENCAGQSPGAIGFGQPDPACATGGATKAASSATCARFKQQCGGDVQGCMKAMSAIERAKIQSDCLDGATAAAEEPVRQGTAGFGTASASSGISSGGGGLSSGTGGSASLDDLSKLKSLADSLGQPEGAGDSLRVDGAGGYSSSSSDGGMPPSPESSLALHGATPASAGRSLASSVDGPVAANATDVDNRFGPSVFSILSSVLKARCVKGRFMHCTPNIK